MRKLIASVALVTAVAVGGLAVAAVNPLQFVSARSSSGTTSQAEPGSGKADKASKTHKDGARKKRSRFAGKLLDQALAGLIKKGTITNEQATAVKEAIQAQVKEARKGHDGHGKGAFRKGLRRGVIATSAKTIGVTPADLVKALKSGKSIAQVAQAKGVDPQKVIDAIVSGGTTKIDAAVKAGKIDAAKAAKIKQRLPKLAEKVVNRVPRRSN